MRIIICILRSIRGYEELTSRYISYVFTNLVISEGLSRDSLLLSALYVIFPKSTGGILGVSYGSKFVCPVLRRGQVAHRLSYWIPAQAREMRYTCAGKSTDLRARAPV